MAKNGVLGGNAVVELGRSMIEMLGVLAIVGILSVGGISAFRKAMSKHDINQAMEEMAEYVNKSLRYSSDWRRLFNEKRKGGYLVNLTSEVDFFIPAKWKRTNRKLYDSMGNEIETRLRNDWGGRPMWSSVYVLTGRDEKIKMNLCITYFNQLKLYADSIWAVMLWRRASGVSDKNLWAYGNNYCGGDKKCLLDLTFEEIVDRCKVFQGKASGQQFEVYFPI
ncbi:MAG: hypothetical protein J6J35_08090 [Alphaproteobacteria bacterium]|nr:hypothetical protein [Alphaproteobacteria bacterium]